MLQVAGGDGVYLSERMILNPHPEERALARVSKDDRPVWGRMFETARSLSVGPRFARTRWRPLTMRVSQRYFPLLVNFFTAALNSSVCMQSMMPSRSASSCCSIVVLGD